jgi:hypothetical protein
LNTSVLPPISVSAVVIVRTEPFTVGVPTIVNATPPRVRLSPAALPIVIASLNTMFTLVLALLNEAPTTRSAPGAAVVSFSSATGVLTALRLRPAASLPATSWIAHASLPAGSA